MSLIQTVVIGHINRADAALDLSTQLHGKAFIDEGDLGEWNNHRRALIWAAARNRGGWTLVLQDDAIIRPDLLEQCEQAVMSAPILDTAIGLYFGRVRPWPEKMREVTARADAAGASWISGRGMYWGVGILMPTDEIAAALAWSRRRPSWPYDQRIGSYFVHRHRRVLYTWPSLVDHSDAPSLLAGHDRDGVRRAWRTGTPEWNSSVVDIAG